MRRYRDSGGGDGSWLRSGSLVRQWAREGSSGLVGQRVRRAPVQEVCKGCGEFGCFLGAECWDLIDWGTEEEIG